MRPIWGVNAGIGRAAVVLQQGINQLTPGAIATLALNVGPLTRRHSTALAEAGRQLELAEATLDQRAAWPERPAPCIDVWWPRSRPRRSSSKDGCGELKTAAALCANWPRSGGLHERLETGTA